MKEALIWIFRAIQVGLVLVVLWMKSEFVTKDQYTADQAKNLSELIRIGNTLTHIDDQLSILIKSTDDHENRIRKLEEKR